MNIHKIVVHVHKNIKKCTHKKLASHTNKLTFKHTCLYKKTYIPYIQTNKNIYKHTVASKQPYIHILN